MNLDTAIGELITGRVRGLELDDDNRDALRTGLMSGITLFKDNASDLSQLLGLIEDIKRASFAPAMIAVDQEGGAVQRFDHVITELPSAMAVGALGVKAARSIAEISGKELNLLGVNVVFSPCLDIATNPRNPIIATRSYGSSASLVAEMGAATAATFLDHKVLPVGKHFPGHGDTAQDSHLDLPALNFDRARLDGIEMAPFVACLPSLPAVLTAHVWMSQFEKEPLPASLSYKITTGILREELGFNGLVFTDDMLMKAITSRWGLADACVMALIAGADQLLVCTDAGEVRKVHAAIKKAVSDGRLSEDRILASVERRKIAMELIGANTKTENETEGELNAFVEKRQSQFNPIGPYHYMVSFAIACASETLVRGKLPEAKPDSKWTIIVPDHERYRLNLAQQLQGDAGSEKRTVVEHRIALDPNDDDIEKTSKLLKSAEGHRILLTYKGMRNSGQLKLARTLCAANLLDMIIATDAPEDVMAVPQCENALVTCDPSNLSMFALAHVLTGQAQPTGAYQMAAVV